MRSGGCAVQQALTPEAAGVVKQAVVLAKRRGHAQVTPLHVANTMMAAAGGGGGCSLLRAACLQSHSHPLQCKALELCFNVALNRLPSAASSCNPIVAAAHHSAYPSISNALVAAFKRAQAHQRRGGDNQQQAALLTVKIELDQLIISILDDPSVSRVMREAGFSSTQVKNNVEKAISSSHASRNFQEENKVVVVDHPWSPPAPSTHSDGTNPSDDDQNTIIEALMRSKRSRNLVVVGESISKVEKTVEHLMGRVEREREGVPETLREVKFITFPPFYTFCNVRRELVQQKMQEVAFLVKSLVGEGKGVVLYLGDLNWISEYRVSLERERSSYYCSVEHMIVEVGRLVSGFADIGRLWLMGIATFQTYMKCRNNGYNSLHMIWRLHPITIPAHTLGFTLLPHTHSGHENDDDCHHNCSSSRFQEVAQHNLENGATFSTLPSWLKDESKRLSNYNHQKFESTNDEQPKSVERSLTLSTPSPSPSPSSSTCCFSIDQHNPNVVLPSNPCSTGNSPSGQKFKEFNANNLNILCNALEEKVPWQKEIIPEIAGTVLQCRSRMLRRKEAVQGNHDPKEEAWLFFLGSDVRGKEEIARNLAKFVFGSYSDFVSIGIERFARAVSDNPHRVFLVEDFELADCSWRMRIKRAIERGRMMSDNGEEFCLFDAIVVLSCERLSSCFEKKMEVVGDVGLDLNMSCGDDDVENLQSMDDLGIIENVDRLVVFKI